MRTRPILRCLAIVAGLAAVGSALAHVVAPPGHESAPISTANHEPVEVRASALVGSYCGSCHHKGRAGADLDSSLDLAVLRRDLSTWRKVVKRIRNHEMPPKGFPQLSAHDREVVVAWVERDILQTNLADVERGDLMVRRLSRAEYVNAVRDLLGVPFA